MGNWNNFIKRVVDLYIKRVGSAREDASEFETDSAREFISACNGRERGNVDGFELTDPNLRYLRYISKQYELLPPSKIYGLLLQLKEPNTVSLDDIFVVLTAIARLASTNASLSVDDAIDYLVDAEIFVPVKDSVELYLLARKFIFIAISWICMLYTPATLGTPNLCSLDVVTKQSFGINTKSQKITEAKHSICALIQRFGTMLPVKPIRPAFSAADGNGMLEVHTINVSELNVKTLSQVGNVNIEWISNISSHLAFDPERKCVLIFALPSFCLSFQLGDTTFARILSDYYSEYTKPENFSVFQYLQEVRLSYRLLFGDDEGAYKHFKGIVHESKDAIGFVDPSLDDLCKITSAAGHPTTSYSTERDFPILGPRLQELQRYIRRQSPGSIKMLWQDRRDMLRWYTFWVVTIVGGFGLLFTVIGTGLAAAQVYYSMPQHQHSVR